MGETRLPVELFIRELLHSIKGRCMCDTYYYGNSRLFTANPAARFELRERGIPLHSVDVKINNNLIQVH